MAIENLPDEDLIYVPDASDETGENIEPGIPVDPELTPDDDPSAADPDDPVTAGQLDEGEIEDSPEFDPINGGADEPDDTTPIYQREGDFITLDVPTDDQGKLNDAGDLYSASTGSPDDVDWDAAPDADPAVQALAAADDDFEVEVFGVPEEDDSEVSYPVQYEIQGKSDVAAWHTMAVVSAQSMDAEVAGLPTSENWTFRIRAIYDDGFIGPWSAETPILLPKDLLAPPVPSMPTLTAARGVITVSWDGSTMTGEPQPADYKHTAVWVSGSGEVGTWNIVGLLFRDGGDYHYTSAEYNKPIYFALSSRDNAGNESARSPAAMATLRPLVKEPDIQAELDRIDAEYNGVITEAGQIGDRMRQAETDLAEAQEHIDALVTVDMPRLENSLADADAKIRTIETVTIPDVRSLAANALSEAQSLGPRLNQAEADLADHGTRLAAADAAIIDLNNVKLPALDAGLKDLRDVKLPAANARIDATNAALEAAGTELNGKLATANTELAAQAQRLADAEADIDAAQTDIDTSKTAIANAQSSANKALLLAPVSTAAPTVADGSGRPVNTIWTRINAAGAEIGYWRWTGTAWTAMPLDATVIPNLSAGKITSGTIATARLNANEIAAAFASVIQLNADRIVAGTVNTDRLNVTDIAAKTAAFQRVDVKNLFVSNGTFGAAVIDKLWADVITARKLNVGQLNVGSLDNLQPSPRFEIESDWGTWIGSSTDLSYFQATGGMDGGTRLAIKNDPGNPDLPAGRYGAEFPVEPGASYRVSGWFYTGFNTNGVARIYARFPGAGAGGANIVVRAVTSDSAPASTWVRISGVVKAPDTATTMRIAPSNTSASVWVYYDKMRVSRMSDADLVVDGTITGDKIEANTVAAKVATVIELNASRIVSGTINTDRLNANEIAAKTAAFQRVDVKNLFATNATLNTAVIEKLWTEVVHSRRITAEMLAVGTSDNFIVDSEFLDPILNDQRKAAGTNIGGIYTSAVDGRKYFQLTASDTVGRLRLFAEKTDRSMIVIPGMSYRMRYQACTPVSATERVDTRLYMACTDAAGVVTNVLVPSSTYNIGTQWTWCESTFVVPENIIGISPYVQRLAGGTAALNIKAPELTRMYGGELIVDGSITGNEIAANTINADNLNVNNVAASIANVIELNASRIVAGKIDTARLDTFEIAAQTAMFQKVYIQNLSVSGSGTFSSAVVEKLWTDVLHAKKITTDMLAVGSFDNMVSDQNFEDAQINAARIAISNDVRGPYTSAYNGFKYFIVDPSTSTGRLRLVASAENSRLPVVSGAKYRVRYLTSSSSAGNAKTYALASVLLSDGTVQNIFDDRGASGSTVESTSAWTWYNGVITMPENAKAAYIYIVRSADGATAGGALYVQQPIVTRMSGGELIVDGAITGDKIAAKSIEAGHLKANSVDANAISAGAIDGLVITGATLRTNSAGTGITINNSGIEARTSAGRQFYLNAATGAMDARGSVTTGSDDTYRAKLSNRDGIAALDIYTAGGDAAHHAALIAWDDSIALRRYTNKTVYGAELAMTPTYTSLRHANNGSRLYMDGSSADLDGSAGATVNGGTGTARLTASGGVNITSAGNISIGARGIANSMEFKEDSTSQYVISVPIYNRRYTSAANLYITSNGVIGLTSSSRKYKAAIETMDNIDDKLLSIRAATWFDKGEAEAVAELTRCEAVGESFLDADGNEKMETPATLRRIPGVIAEEVLEAGLEEFIQYGPEGTVEGVMYDRLGVALIPVVKRQRDRIETLESQMAALLARVEALEVA